MDKLINGPKAIVGAKIGDVTSILSGVHPDTGREYFRYFFELSNGLKIELEPGEIVHRDRLPAARKIANLQVVDGPQTITGEEILAVVRRKDTIPGLPWRGVADLPPRQVALILSSDRAARNMFRGGGGTILMIESVDGLTWHSGEEWRDRWTDEVIVISPIGKSST